MPQQNPVALPQPVDFHVHGAFLHAERFGGVALRGVTGTVCVPRACGIRTKI